MSIHRQTYTERETGKDRRKSRHTDAQSDKQDIEKQRTSKTMTGRTRKDIFVFSCPSFVILTFCSAGIQHRDRTTNPMHSIWPQYLTLSFRGQEECVWHVTSRGKSP